MYFYLVYGCSGRDAGVFMGGFARKFQSQIQAESWVGPQRRKSEIRHYYVRYRVKSGTSQMVECEWEK